MRPFVVLERGTCGKVAQLDLAVELLFIVVLVDADSRSSEHVPTTFPGLGFSRPLIQPTFFEDFVVHKGTSFVDRGECRRDIDGERAIFGSHSVCCGDGRNRREYLSHVCESRRDPIEV